MAELLPERRPERKGAHQARGPGNSDREARARRRPRRAPRTSSRTRPRGSGRGTPTRRSRSCSARRCRRRRPGPTGTAPSRGRSPRSGSRSGGTRTTSRRALRGRRKPRNRLVSPVPALSRASRAARAAPIAPEIRLYGWTVTGAPEDVLERGDDGPVRGDAPLEDDPLARAASRPDDLLEVVPHDRVGEARADLRRRPRRRRAADATSVSMKTVQREPRSGGAVAANARAANSPLHVDPERRRLLLEERPGPRRADLVHREVGDARRPSRG